MVPVYISEVAPFASRGALAYLFQLAVTVGILAAQVGSQEGLAACHLLEAVGMLAGAAHLSMCKTAWAPPRSFCSTLG